MRVAPGGFLLPPAGAAIAVVAEGQTVGHIVLEPDGRSGTALDARQLAVALADQYAVAMKMRRAPTR